MKIKGTIGICIGLLGLLLGSTSFAVEKSKSCEDIVIQGGEIPVPLRLPPNHKVELANGECYKLVGKFRRFGRYDYFFVDLKVHPWLANERRSFLPVYPVERDGISIGTHHLHSQDRVSVLVKAKGEIVIDRGKAYYTISVVPVQKPQLFRGR